MKPGICRSTRFSPRKCPRSRWVGVAPPVVTSFITVGTFGTRRMAAGGVFVQDAAYAASYAADPGLGRTSRELPHAGHGTSRYHGT